MKFKSVDVCAVKHHEMLKFNYLQITALTTVLCDSSEANYFHAYRKYSKKNPKTVPEKSILNGVFFSKIVLYRIAYEYSVESVYTTYPIQRQRKKNKKKIVRYVKVGNVKKILLNK